MPNIKISKTILGELELLIKQARQALAPIKSEIDFSKIAYVWKNQQLIPVQHPKPMHLDDLLAIDTQKAKLVQNTLQFIHGLPANDVLLTGARGTGKSSLVRALLTDFADQGLRLIEIERDDLVDLATIQSLISARPEKFIIYCDDMAFNAEDQSYRALKSALDGSIQSGNANTLIYATSNRRHLLPEFMHENTPQHRVDVPQHNELHPQEAVEEKISLSDRFGLWLSFYAVNQHDYLQIVSHCLAKAGISCDKEVSAAALKWSLTRGQRSGRAAFQFSKHWIGQQKLNQLLNLKE